MRIHGGEKVSDRSAIFQVEMSQKWEYGIQITNSECKEL